MDAAVDVDPMTWWWCLRHGKVEQEHDCRSGDRLGPFATEQEAAGALETARRRTAERDAQDRAEDDWGRD